MRDLISKLRTVLEDWSETEHPRADDGKFGSGSGGAKAEAPKKGKAKTFSAARAEIQGHLEKKGWKMSPSSLKIPHATSPDGETRVWFKAQAVYVTQGNRHDFKNARTLDYAHDIRKMDGPEFEKYVTDTLARRK